MPVNFSVSTEDAELLHQIVQRAMDVFERIGRPANRLDLAMDLTACHATKPLRLRAWLDADEMNFFHDVTGIQANMDRDTGRLLGTFEPRFLKPPALGEKS